jgi:hypothetical protein
MKYVSKMQIIWTSLFVYDTCKERKLFEQAFYRLIFLVQKNNKINILAVPLNNNFEFPTFFRNKKIAFSPFHQHLLN